MKNLETLSIDALKLKLIHTEHFLMKAVYYKQAYIPFLSQGRKRLSEEYHRRLYGR